MKVVSVLGSPRPRGNSSAIARRFCEAAEKLGARVQTFSLNKLTYKGCQACMACKTRLDRCVLEDDLTEVLDAVRKADVLVMSTPVFFGEVSSQLKGFIDRTFSYLLPDFATNPDPSRLAPGKKLVFIQTQAEPDEGQFGDVFPRYEYFFKWYGFRDNHLIRCAGVSDKGEAEARRDVMDRAGEVARKVLK